MEETIFEIISHKGMIPGMAVISTAGHDTGSIYIIVRVDGRIAYLADGRLRHVARLKKKRVCHFKLLGQAMLPEQTRQLSELDNERANQILRKSITAFLSDKASKE
jgi:ribosomal protein L14E/L6E/L27E